MSPLIALLLFGFMFVIALSLTLWAALTLGDGRGAEDDVTDSVDYVPFGTQRPVWRHDEPESRGSGIERRSATAGNGSGSGSGRRRSSDRGERRTGLPPLREDAAPATSATSATSESSDSSHGSHGSKRSHRSTVRTVAVRETPHTSHEPGPKSEPGSHDPAERRHDEYRGARATVTQRPNHDDAFERFLDNERD